jgi:hypothetical protein
MVAMPVRLGFARGRLHVGEFSSRDVIVKKSQHFLSRHEENLYEN